MVFRAEFAPSFEWTKMTPAGRCGVLLIRIRREHRRRLNVNSLAPLRISMESGLFEEACYYTLNCMLGLSYGRSDKCVAGAQGFI